MYQRQLAPARVLGEAAPQLGETVFENEGGVRAFTSGDGVLVVSFTSKAHAVARR